MGFDLHLSDLCFEGLPVQEWGDAITGYTDYFQREMVPSIVNVKKNNLRALREEVLAVLEEQAGRLPQHNDLYPGGLDAAMQVMQSLGQLIQKRLQYCLPFDKEDALRSSLESTYETAMNDMDRLVSSFPALPRWLRRLPGPLYSYGVMLFTYLFRRKEYRRLMELREACVHALEQKFSLDFEQDARRALTDLCHAAMESLAEMNQHLHTLLASFAVIQDQLDDQGKLEIKPASPFRAFPMNEDLLAWAFERSRHSTIDFRNELLDAGFLLDWKQATAEQLQSSLLAHCQDVFRPLRDLGVEELLQQSGENALLSTLTTLTQGVVPLLRPDFDLAGEGISFQAQFCLCAEPHVSRIPPLLKEAFGEWQYIATGDPTITLCCRTRLMLAANALQGLFQRGREALAALSDEQRCELPDRKSCQDTGAEKA